MFGTLKTTVMAYSALVLAFVSAEIVQGAQPQPLALGYSGLRFAAPTPGTYKLPILGQASDGNVLDSDGRAITLHELMGNGDNAGKVIVLSFIYATCSDVNGCPLATAVFHKIKNRLEEEPKLAQQLRLLTLSFNPEHDTPERMKEYGASLQGKGVEWHFLTTRSEQDLQPILKNYKQTIEKIYAANGNFTNTYNHNLRVYLIDQHKRLRNIYNTELLHPDMVINDIKTLLLPDNKSSAITSISSDKPELYGAGDNKLSYENKDYLTQSNALTHRKGQPADLIKTVTQPPLGLPSVPIPDNNPITLEKINLGRKLFYDRRLSINNTFSCAMCHVPEQGFTNNEMATAVGVEGRTVRRNSPTLYNVAYLRSLFHDGRETTLENQVWGPLLARNEMANPSIGYVIDKIKGNSDYNGLFEKTFGKSASIDTIGMAIASYERTLNSANSPFDRWYYGKDESAIDPKSKRGFALFNGKARCGQCHHINKDFALLTDNNLHNTGIGFVEAMNKPAQPTQKVQVSPGVYVEVDSKLIASVAETKANDLGRYEVTQKPEDRWRYKTPSLRNISLSAPYMHNGSLANLREVVEFYNRGGSANENLDPLIKPLNFTLSEIDDLVSYLQALTGSNTDELIGDGFAAPVGDSH